MIAAPHARLTSLLQACGLFAPERVEELLALNKVPGSTLTRLVVDNHFAAEEDYLRALAGAMDIPYQRLGETPPAPEVLAALPARAVYQYGVIPVELAPGILRVATSDPFKPGMMDALRLSSGLRIRFALCVESEIEKAAKNFYGVGGETIERMMQDGRIEVAPDEDHLEKHDLTELDEEASVVKFVNQIIWEAHEEGATDIHIEPMEKDLRIRYRVDGLLLQTPVPQALKRFQAAIITRIKVMANMDIAERRLPQDGRIGLRIRGEEIDIRVSTMPTTYGESVSLRLLMRTGSLLHLSQLGLNKDHEHMVARLISRPHGIILVTGPTGSGKSTSLYAFLHTINSIDQRIITTEDPVEYEMPGINQVQMKPEIGLTFAVGLRHILRQDPDIIMVGEIRDKETAEISIQAALTGHLVFSTLHTNDAASGFTRLLDMGIEPFLVASSIEAIVAQRLIRKLCTACRRPRPLDPAFLDSVGFPQSRLGEGTIHEAVGCEACRRTGFKGRTGIYEILTVTDRIRTLVTTREPASMIRNEAVRHDGMVTLREDGWNKVLAGVTTIEEVVRASAEEDAES